MKHRHSVCGGPLSFEGSCGGCERCIPGLYDDEEPEEDDGLAEDADDARREDALMDARERGRGER